MDNSETEKKRRGEESSGEKEGLSSLATTATTRPVKKGVTCSVLVRTNVASRATT